MPGCVSCGRDLIGDETDECGECATWHTWWARVRQEVSRLITPEEVA